MSFHTPTGWAERCTYRDPEAAHQIVLTIAIKGFGVSCHCRPKLAPFTVVKDADQALAEWRRRHKACAACTSVFYMNGRSRAKYCINCRYVKRGEVAP